MKHTLLSIFVFSLLLCACNSREELSTESVLISEIKHTDSLDQWLYQTYTKPYNIEVKYRWDANTTGLTQTTTPPTREQVEPAMQAVNLLWIEVYKKLVGEDFLKRYAPKEIYLYGGKNLDSEGYEQIKSTHAPLQMPLFKINDFKKSDSTSVAQVMRMVHHHFAKALIQQKPFDKEAFSQLNFYAYNTNWGKHDINELYHLTTRASDFGYYSLLAARGSVEEDFAETVSAMLCSSKQDIDEMIEGYAGYANPYDPEDKERARKAVKTLNAKRAFVIKYFKDNFDLNFNRLQFESVAQLKTYLK